MKSFLSSTLLSASLAAALFGIDPAPAAAATLDAGAHLAGQDLFDGTGAAADEFDRRGRGRGRGGDDRHGGRDDDDDDRGGRRGGHGSDDGPGNHNGGAGSDDRGGRGGHGGRPRIPGGSGCDDPHDIIEHPECRVPVAP